MSPSIPLWTTLSHSVCLFLSCLPLCLCGGLSVCLPAACNTPWSIYPICLWLSLCIRAPATCTCLSLGVCLPLCLCGCLSRSACLPPGSLCVFCLSIPSVCGCLSVSVHLQPACVCPSAFAYLSVSVTVSVSVFMAHSTVFHPINSPDNSPLSQSVLPVLLISAYWSFELYSSSWKSPSTLI